MPAGVVGGWLLLKSCGWNYRHRIAAGGAAATAILLMAVLTAKFLIAVLAQGTNVGEMVKADLKDIQTELAGSKRAIEFAYRTPFADYGEGFLIIYASIPRMTEEYVRSRQRTFSSMVGGLFDRDVGAYIIDKGYFSTVESIKAATNVVPLGPKPVAFKDGDRLIELHTVFILIRG